MALVVIYDRSVVIHAWKIRFPRNQTSKQKSQSRSDRILALKMLVYPAAYTVTVSAVCISILLSES